MDKDTAAALLAALRACGLYAPAVLAAPLPAAPADAADMLLGRGVVTPYQHRKIRSGRTDEILFGPFLILDKIGEGGMGKVYRAVQTDAAVGGPAGRVLALKIVRQHLMANRTVLRRFEREAAAAATLDHPNVVKLFAASDIEGRFYLAMEYVDGIDLSRLTKQFGNPPHAGLPHYQESCEYVRQAALGLSHAHARGLIHRDIKPANLLVSGDRALPGTTGTAQLKILDMGLVRSFGGDDDGNTDLTRDGTVVGTPDYMSPEQAKNSSTVDPRADLYSLGCTLYYLLRGQPLFPDGSPLDKLMRHYQEGRPDIRKARPDVPAGLAEVLGKLIRIKPAERYQTAADVAAALAPFVAGTATVPVYEPFSFTDDPTAVTPTRPPPPRPGPTPAPAPSRRLRVVVPRPAGGPAPSPTPSAATTAVPPAAPVPKAQAKRPAVAIPHAGTAESSDSLPGTSRTPSRPARSRTDLPRRRPPVKPQPARKPGIPPVAWWAGGAAVVALLLAVVGVVVFARPPRPDPGPQAAQPDTPKTGTPAAAPLPAVRLAPIGDRVPAGATAVLVVHPEEYWKRAAAVKTRDEVLRGNVGRLARRRFDLTRLQRVVATFTTDIEPAVAVAEGPFLTDAWQADFDTLPKAGGPLTDRRAVGFPGPRGPQYGVILDNQSYAVGSDGTAMFTLAEKRRAAPAEWLRMLPPAGETPLAAFAADGAYTLPTGKKLADLGLSRAGGTLRLVDGGFELTVTVAAPISEGLGEVAARAGLAVIAGEVFAQFPPLAPFGSVLTGPPTTADRGGEVEVTMRGTVPWDKAHAALEALLPAGGD